MLGAVTPLMAASPVPLSAGVAGQSPLPAPAAAASGAGFTPEVEACLRRAARYHDVPLPLLRAIAQVESGGNPRARHTGNRDGSEDIGLMQINAWWLPQLARWGIGVEQLEQPCVSAYVGAWILAGEMRRHGRRWRAVGAYNARQESRRAAYVARVQRALRAWGDFP